MSYSRHVASSEPVANALPLGKNLRCKGGELWGWGIYVLSYLAPPHTQKRKEKEKLILIPCIHRYHQELIKWREPSPGKTGFEFYVTPSDDISWTRDWHKKMTYGDGVDVTFVSGEGLLAEPLANVPQLRKERKK